jgi:hypothetical protein
MLAPQHRALAAPRQPSDQRQAEPGCRPGVPRNHLVQGAAQQTSSQPTVYVSHPERTTNFTGAAALQGRYLTAQNGELGTLVHTLFYRKAKLPSIPLTI